MNDNDNTMNEYLKTNPLSMDVQLLWRIHLIHPIKCNTHFIKLCNIDSFSHSSFPSYSLINLTLISSTKNEHIHIHQTKNVNVNTLIFKQIFESIDFKTMIPAYLTWMQQILLMIQKEPNYCKQQKLSLNIKNILSIL